ncbi:MAG: DUF362 domain-containing protein [Methanobrevibacter sp.]|jgi:uncharacterized protein (DUF362 family)|nr:DUF362 domain-containing protein [Methanobrevibacter sp.]
MKEKNIEDKIYINYGTDYKKMTIDLMEKAKINEDLNPKMKVVIKPNLILPSPAKNGATTHSEIVEAIIIYLQKNKIKDISIAEGAWVGVKNTYESFKVCGYEKLKKQYNVNLIDTKKEETTHYNVKGIDFNICKIFKEADYLINVPVLKGHCQTKLTCCMKNLKGCIPDKDKRYYHTIGLHDPIAILTKLIKPNLNIVDSICGDLDYEEGGNPIPTNRILLSKDPLLMDSYCAKLIAYNPEEIEYLKKAKNLNIGNIHSNKTELIELNKQNKSKKQIIKSKKAKPLEKYIKEDSACSPCYANLIHGINKLNNKEKLNNYKINIGQGFKEYNPSDPYKKLNNDYNDDKEKIAIGIGNCCNKFTKNLKGCPPSGLEILNFLNSL